MPPNWKCDAANLLLSFSETCAAGLNKLPSPEWFLLIKVEAPQGLKWPFLLGKQEQKSSILSSEYWLCVPLNLCGTPVLEVGMTRESTCPKNLPLALTALAGFPNRSLVKEKGKNVKRKVRGLRWDPDTPPLHIPFLTNNLGHGTQLQNPNICFKQLFNVWGIENRF